MSANCSVALRLEVLGGVPRAHHWQCSAFLSGEFIRADLAGLALIYALLMTSMLNIATRLWPMVDQSFNSSERLNEYTMGVKTRGSECDRGPLSSLARGWTGDCTSMATITPTIALISLLLKWPHLFRAPGAQGGASSAARARERARCC